MKWSDQQIAVRDGVASGQSCKIVAYAGTGKTETLLLSAIAHGRPGIYFAFNRAIAEEGKIRFGREAPNIQVSTVHSYAFREVGRFYAHRLQRSPWQFRSALRDRFTGQLMKLARSPAEFDRMIFAVMDVVRLFEQSDSQQLSSIHLPAEFADAIALKAHAESILFVAQQAWEDMANRNGTLPISHDTYLKIFQLSEPRIPTEIMYLDEAQDANPVMRSVMVSQEHTQQVYAGDSHQALYRFRGSVDAMTHIHLPELPLTVSWRFGKGIAEVANLVLKAKQAKWPLEGGGPAGKVTLRSMNMPTAVLSRTNAGMVDIALEQMQAGQRVAILGGAEAVASMIEGAYSLWLGGKSEHPTFRLFANWAELEEAAETTHGGSLRPFVRLVDRWTYSIPELALRLRRETVTPEMADVLLSTVHSFKGKQSSVVQLAGDFPLFAEEGPSPDHPHRVAGLVEDEANVAYVALTRAQTELQLSLYMEQFRRSLEIMKPILGATKLSPNN
jgi:superfamily I DNA/RNA helicase